MNQKELTDSFLAIKKELLSFVFRLISQRQDAEDIVQETYLRVHEKIAPL
ncbi:MAG: sigma factor [Reinekea sp.]